MAERKKKKRGGISTFLGLTLLFAGFILGLYARPILENAFPKTFLTNYQLKRPETEAPAKKLTAQQGADAKADNGRYTLEIAVFKDVESALGLADTLSTRGYKPYLQVSDEAYGALYVLRIGFWTTEAEARAFAERFKKDEEMKSRVVKIE